MCSLKPLLNHKNVCPQSKSKWSKNADVNCIVNVYSELSENYEKMTLKSNFGNHKKTRSDSKTDSNVRLKVRNAGPQLM